MPAIDLHPHEHEQLGCGGSASFDAEELWESALPGDTEGTAMAPAHQPSTSVGSLAESLGCCHPADASGEGAVQPLGGLAQFLLLDEDECCGAGVDGHEHGAAPPAPACEEVTPRCGQMQGVDSTTSLYCLAVVDEATGLPLRAATPEEAWEAERCFVLQHSELLAGQAQRRAALAARQAACDSVQQKQNQNQAPVVGEGQQEGERPARRAARRGGQQATAQQQQQQAQQQQASDGKKSISRQQSSTAKAEDSGDASDAAALVLRRQEPRRCGPCDNCGAIESPQWRQGPASKPQLCNRCGMRFRRTNSLAPPAPPTVGAKRAAEHAQQHAPAASAVRVRVKVPAVTATAAALALVPPQQLAADGKRPRRAGAGAHMAAAIDACA
ncbi:hypothetical protein FOA52_000815 [Chlamydomonas sp. UWO 241]|nr:hypothetical protein FOA52_000815 [Chlamydomonas sp. UWO 241]